MLYDKLFNFDISSVKRIYSTNNEIYNQLILYMFFSLNKNILLVFSSLNEATTVYNNLKNYVDETYIFPEDDFMTKKSIAMSPELLYIRLRLLNNIRNDNKKIVITHYNSFVRKLPSISDFDTKKIVLKVGDSIDRNNLISKLNDIGYKKESLVTNSGEYSVRGYVIDIYPIHSDNPVRIELFDDVIDKIKYFNAYSQMSNGLNEIESLSINVIKDDFGNNNTSIIDYLDDVKVIYNNYDDIKKIEQMILPQVKYLDIEKDIFKLSDFNCDDIKIDTINNKGDFDLVINSRTLSNYYNNNDGFYNDIKKYNGILYTLNDKIITNCINNDIKYVKGYLNSGFEYLGNYYFSDNDLLFANKKSRLESDFKYGTKIDSLSKIEVGDYVVHRKSGIGIYMGIKTLTKNGIKKDYILIQYKGNDRLYLPVQDIDKLYKYTSKEGTKPTIYKLNSAEWNKTKLRIKERIKNITSELLKIYKERNIASTIPYSKDDENQIIFESSFEYEETSDQRKVTDEIKRDLESGRPMDRLLCGDVGYGKTEVIFRAIFKTVMNGKQAMYLCPTTILSLQQYNSALDRFKDYGVNVDLINRNFSDSQIKNKIELLKEGKTDVIFGTHRLLSNDIEFKDLGLLVIDEEHRFGVEQKEKIKSLKSNVHVLSVSATPIPRSLQMSLTGIRDMSLIETAPRNRYPVQTYVIEYNDMLLRDAVIKELSRNGQVFILFNNIINMEELVSKYKKLIPEARICYAHGKMNKDVMNDVISDFKNYKYDVLVSTTIIENGIDIPNANTIIVIDADKFGLSQLYQIRGRVGRSDRIAYAYLMYKKDKMLNSTSIKRLDAMKEFTELGSGYRISMRDLAIRGAGDILGSEQAGFIDSVGVDMYLELINESINNIDEDNEETNNVHSLEVQTHIDEKYSDESDIVIDLHKKINSIVNKEDLDKILDEVKDRFGIVDESIKLYAYEKYYENLVKINNINVVEDNNIRITFSIKPSVYNNLDVQELFVRTSGLSTKFNFNYKNNVIFVSLLKGNLDKNYIYYVTSFMEIIFDLKK